MSDKKLVTVSVSAPTGVGKSTIAAVIAKALEQHGFSVTNRDPDIATTVVPLEERAGAVAARADVVIEHVLEAREART